MSGECLFFILYYKWVRFKKGGGGEIFEKCAKVRNHVETCDDTFSGMGV